MDTSHTFTLASTATSAFARASTFNCSNSSMRIYRIKVFMAASFVKLAIEFCSLFNSPQYSSAVAATMATTGPHYSHQKDLIINYPAIVMVLFITGYFEPFLR